jgi:Abortive infection alpha
MSATDPREPPTDEHPVAADLAAVARAVAVGGVRAGAWAAVTGVRAGQRAVDVVRHPDHAAQLAEDLREAAAAITDALTGDDQDGAGHEDAEPRGRDRTPERRVQDRPTDPTGLGHGTRPLRPVVRLSGRAPHVVHPAPDAEPANPLHQAAQELLRQSRDVWTEDRGHPAYARIIEELAPDEARILVLLVRQGPQPTVDVRTGGVLGLVSSTLVAARLTMIGAHAGCRYVERVPSYLNNLERLGLIWFPLDPLKDPVEYQVLEAQPDVVAARASVRRSRIVRRSIHLTPFGSDFCRDGLGLQPTDEDPRVIPEHASPGVA